MNARTFNIGDTTTAQLGNAGDSSGYQENVPVTILGTRKNILNYNVHLIQINERSIGIATESIPGRNIKGELYCTSSCGFGKAEMFPDLKSAACYMGFKL